MWDIFPDVRKLKYDVMAGLNAHFDELVDKRIAQRQANEETLMILLKQCSTISRIVFTYALSTLLCAGHDTTAFWMLHVICLAHNQHVQDN